MPRRKRQPAQPQLITEKEAIARFGKPHAWFYRHKDFLQPQVLPLVDARRRYFDVATIEALIALQRRPMACAS